ncbi:putative sulfate exporter family transporter [Spirosoma flavum]|uniref:Sulfate exporter family transporter n=1 Tax=Spirosoma flavum TaxID=2048557 RepID=A0ABW6AHW1_9BACT
MWSGSFTAATTVKLARVLSIIPATLGIAALSRMRNRKVSILYFAVLFIVAIIAHTYLLTIEPVAVALVHIAHIGLILTLFLIGSGLF